jgi:hypothetical protein
VHWCAATTKGADRAVVYIFRHIAITLFCGPCDQLIKNLSPWAGMDIKCSNALMRTVYLQSIIIHYLIIINE